MKLVKPGSRRRKIILYYTLAVVLPGIVLGYLAYRGIRNDQALREKENLKRLDIISQAFFSEIDSSFVRFMNRNSSEEVLAGHKVADPSILTMVVRDSSGSKKLIYHQLLYLPADQLPTMPEKPEKQASLKEGIRLEFAERKYSEALRFYQDIVNGTADRSEKIQALVASARLYNKMNQPDKAKILYNEMREDYPGLLLNGQIPLALMAGLEIMKINLAAGENIELGNNCRQCLKLLLYPSCEYNSDQFNMFCQSFREIIPESDPVIDSLFQQLDIQRARTDYLIRLITAPEIALSDVNDHVTGRKNEIASKPVNSTDLSAMFLSWNKETDEQKSLVIDFPVYLKSISEKLIKKLNPDSSINIKIEDDDGKLIFSNVLKEETDFLSFPFPEDLPNWNLLLSGNKPGFMTTLLQAGSGIYLFVLILIALLMVLGFIFTIYTLNVELRLNKLKSEFISNVSHELKSPLTSIRMMTEMLHHNRVRTEERKSEYYSAMLEESEHLSHLIDNILDFSRIDDDRKKYDFTDLDLDELLVKFLESTRKRLPDPGFEIRYSHPEKVPNIKADRNAILQVFYNLVDNAIKFSLTSRQIDISLCSGDDEVQFCVKDYGIGISIKDQEKIFDRFYRGDEPQRLGIKGSGIGLTIVQKIIEDHKGHMTLESKHMEGSTFCVHLPVNKNT